MTLVVYHLAAALAVVVVQTTVICHITLLGHFYDPALVVVAYMALFIPFWHGMAVVVLMAAGIDQISAAPFGLYFFAYLWLFLVVRWSALFVHAKNAVVLSLLVAGMVIGEHLLFWGLTALTASGPVFGPEAFGQAFGQSLWALGTGAAGVRCLLWGHVLVQGRFHRETQPSNRG